MPLRHRPVCGKDFRLLQDCHGRFLLHVGRIPVFSEDALDQDSEMGSDVFAHRPVNCRVLADSLYKFTGDGPKRFVTENFDRAIIRL